jgi:hypothetical protein
LIFALVALALASCAALGGSSRCANRQAVREVRRVGLAPVLAEASIRAYCLDADSIAGEQLLKESHGAGGFELLPARDWLPASGRDSVTTREALLARAEARGLDAVLFCRVSSSTGETTEEIKEEGWALNFGKGPLIEPYEEVVGTRTVTVWLGAVVELELASSPAGDLLVSSRFDTYLGKSYWSSPSTGRQVADAAKGAARPLLRARLERP